MDNTPKKTRSIVIRLNRHLQWKRFWADVGQDIAVALAAIAGWCYAAESAVCNGWAWNIGRGVTFARAADMLTVLQSAKYYVTDTAGTLHVIDAGGFVLGLCGVLFGLACLQFFAWLIGWVAGRNALRRYLKPIDDIALTAEKIAARGFDPGKIRSFENAIAHINAPDTLVQVGDEDLSGLEAAVNNMLKRLQESARQQMRFVDDASHELRTPIAVIQGYVHMLDRWGKDDPQVLAESIAAIQTEAEHMKTLVEQLLFLARGDMGRTKLALAPLPLAPLLQEIAEESRMIDDAHAYRLELAAEPVVRADVAMLKQAVRILVDNAAKYTDAGGEVLLRLRSAAGEGRIEVQDSGIGIPGDDVAHVFERFFRSDPARKKGGSGLGLSIAKWIVEEHGGHIEVRSFEGVGTRVSICVPEAAAAAV